MPAYDTKWWGWGDAGIRPELPPSAQELLRDEIGEGSRSKPVALESIRVPDAGPLPDGVAAAVGAENVLTGAEDRIRRAAGRSYPDLVRLRSGRLSDAPDAVVRPGSAEEVAAVLEACAAAGIAVVPFGGGTSVVGGVEPHRGSLGGLISLDLGRMRDVAVDRVSRTARLGPGLRGPDAERLLGEQGMTLGHFPQSFEYATIGGFAATRSAGQASSGYGRFDEVVGSLRMVTPTGELTTLETPHTAAGPSLREVALGSEGVLGVITDVTVRVRPVPERRRYEAWMAPDWVSGSEILRALAQEGAAPDVLRLSDRDETRIAFAQSSAPQFARHALGAYLRMRRRREGCLVICGFEGDGEGTARRRSIASRMLRDGGAAALGQAPGRAWEHGRYRGPYLRDTLLDHGVFVETLETSHTWSRLHELYGAVRSALQDALAAGGTPGIVMCHISHTYGDGASLYFTWFARQRAGEELDQWREAKTAACEAIVGAGGTITHHHAVGTDHAPYMGAEVGETGIRALRALKAELDPAGVMNPGKLLPS